MHSQRRATIGTVAVLAALAAVLTGGGCGRGAPGPGQVVAAAVQDLVLDVEVAGTLRAMESDQVGPPASVTDVWQFKLTRMVPEGTQIKPGAEVIAFDESDLEKDLTDRESEVKSYTEELGKLVADNALNVLNDKMALEEAQARLRKAELKADLPSDLTAQIELKVAGVDRKLAQREVEFQKEREQDKRRQEVSDRAILEGRLARSRAAVADIKAEITAMSVKARRSGTVVYRQNSQGEKKKVGDRIWRQDTVVQIAALDRLSAQGQVDEVDASNVAAGQHVGLRLDAHPDREYGGVVERVASLVQTESSESRIKVVQLDIKLTETDPLLMRPGMRFRGRIEIARDHAVLQLPLAAIASTASGPTVTKIEGSGLRTTAVTLGRRSRAMVEVKAGLLPGDRVLLRATHGGATGKSGGAFGLGAS